MRLGHFREQAAQSGKKDRTRAALLDATVRVVAEKGMEALKICDITTDAELANGTFYNHFASKDEILSEAAYGIAIEISRQLDAQMIGIEDGPTRVVTATADFIAIVLAEPDWAAVMLDSPRHVPQLREGTATYLRSDVELGIAQGKFDVVVSGFLLAQIVALLTVALTRQLERGADPQITQQACESILRLLGMTPAKARKTVTSVISQ